MPVTRQIKNKQARVKSEHEAKEAEEDDVADNPVEEAEEARKAQQARVKSEHEAKEDDIADHRGGKLEL